MPESAGARVTETSCRASRPLITRHPSLVTTVLIHGSAIKSHANILFFNYLRFFNRIIPLTKQSL